MKLGTLSDNGLIKSDKEITWQKFLYLQDFKKYITSQVFIYKKIKLTKFLLK